MPATLSSRVSNYDFGAPVSTTSGDAYPLVFKVNQAGKLDYKFENPNGVAAFTATLEVSEDGVTYANTSSTNNITAVVNVVVAPKTSKEGVIGLRAGKDNFLRLKVTGGARGILQTRGVQLGLNKI